MLNNNFCSSPWFHIRINPDGNYVPCRWDFSMAQAVHNVKDTSITQYMNSTVMRNLRTDLLNGQGTTTCASCHNEDQYKKVSGRQRQLLKSGIVLKQFDKTFCASPHWDWFEQSANSNGYTSNMPVDFQIDLGNTCNSACIMCIPLYSSRLVGDYSKLQKIEPVLFNSRIPKGNWTDDPASVDKFVNELAEIPNIKYLHFLGGETLYLKSFYDICNRLIKLGLAKDISIGTTTNCTVFTPELEHILSSFKHAHLGLSIESLHPINDYVRWPSNISTVEKNIKSFINLRNSTDLHLSLRITPSNLSVYHIDTLFEYMLDNSITAESCNLLTNPSCLRLELLPKDILDAVVAKIDKVIEKYNIVDSNNSTINRRNDVIREQVINEVIVEYRNTLKNLQIPDNIEEERYNLVKFIKAFESIRNNNILDYLPEYEEFLRSYGY